MSKHLNIVFGSNCDISDDAILENVICGDDVIINSNCQLKNVTIGNNSKISRNTIIYSPYADKPVFIGKNVWISNGVFAEASGGKIIIDDYAVIAHFATLLSSSGPGAKSIILHKLFPDELGDIIINKHCWIGANSLILPFVSLAEGNVIATGSVVKKQNFMPWSVYAGSPAEFKKQFDLEKIEQIKEELKNKLS